LVEKGFENRTNKCLIQSTAFNVSFSFDTFLL